MIESIKLQKISNYNIFIFISLFLFTNSDKCKDENCQNCSADGIFCFICKKGLIKFQYGCFKKANNITNCILSHVNENICVKCNYGCTPNNGICDCTLKYILYVIYFLITFITIGTFLYCLTHNTLIKYFQLNSNLGFRSFNEVHINNNIEINNSIRELNNENSLKKSKEDLEKEFEKNKIDINDNIDIENKKCDCCSNILCNLYLDCGCYVCFDCEKKSIKENNCLNCHKTFQTMKQISCAICLNNKKELGNFNCQCKMVVCKECYIKWRINNKNCPTCRAVII